MALGKARSGIPLEGTTAANGTDNSLTAPRIIIFDTPARPCIVTNHCQNSEILVKINTELNGTVSNDFDNDSDDDGLGHFVIPPKVTLVDASKDPPEGGECWVDVSLGGLVTVHSVSFVTTHASDDLDEVSVVGWRP